MEEILKYEGFYYDEDNDEWIKPFNGGYIVMYRRLLSWDIWSLSFIDKDDNQKYLIETSDTDEMMSELKMYRRDTIIDTLLNLSQ